MQDNMMIAEGGVIENVRGNRIATPLAPPRPGSTPMITPSTMPTNISQILYGCRTLAKPAIRLPNSSIYRGPAPHNNDQAGFRAAPSAVGSGSTVRKRHKQ